MGEPPKEGKKKAQEITERRHRPKASDLLDRASHLRNLPQGGVHDVTPGPVNLSESVSRYLGPEDKQPTSALEA